VDATRSDRFYDDLARWWPLFSPPYEYGDEAGQIRRVLEQRATGPLRALLELGSGGGHVASHLSTRFELTLVDLSPGMLEVSRALNPGVEHHEGDMYDVRLGRTFDAVLVHDAVMYATTEEQLAAVVATVWAHCRPGGLAVLNPDWTRERFEPSTECGGDDESAEGGGRRGLRYLMWIWDPDPTDTEVVADFAFLLREADGSTSAVHDRHHWGTFPETTWLDALATVGFEAVEVVDEVDGEAPEGVMFVARRPALSQ